MNDANKIPVGIVGASGYSGEQLVRILLRHPHVALTSVTSRQYAGKKLTEIFPGIHDRTSLVFTEPKVEEIGRAAQHVFLALPHGVAAEYAIPLVKAGCKVLDLSADFRLKDPKIYEEFYKHPHPAPDLLPQAVYGSPERHRSALKSASLVACAGCYPTSVILASAPLLAVGAVSPLGIVVNSLSGVSGAGRKAEIDYLFVECNESLRPYGIPGHRHIPEMEQEMTLALRQHDPSAAPLKINFTPHLVPVNRGIISTLAFDLSDRLKLRAAQDACSVQQELLEIYRAAYENEPFVRVLRPKQLPDTKHVVGTNYCDLTLRVCPRTLKVIATSAEDNIIKGASGQAVQCLNIMNGWDETTGLL